jgi:hypothetical protein
MTLPVPNTKQQHSGSVSFHPVKDLSSTNLAAIKLHLVLSFSVQISFSVRVLKLADPFVLHLKVRGSLK